MSSSAARVRTLVRRVVEVPVVTWTLLALTTRGLLPRAVWRRLPAASPVRVAVPNRRATFLFASVEKDERIYFWSGPAFSEGSAASAFVALAEQSRTIVDVGAHAGLYSLMALTANPRATVVAFEPAPPAIALLRANIAHNHVESRCIVRERAASDSCGVAQFHVPDRAEAVVMSSLDPGGFRGIAGEVISVDTERVDDAVSDVGVASTVDLVKIDVEHFEHYVLRGMDGILSGPRPAIIFEAHPDGPFEEVEEILRAHHYEVFALPPTGPRAVRGISEAFGNLLALPEGRPPPAILRESRW